MRIAEDLELSEINPQIEPMMKTEIDYKENTDNQGKKKTCPLESNQ